MKHLGSAKTITEGKNNAELVMEARRNALVKKWSPVLSKMKEVPSQKYGLMAALMENQHANMDVPASCLRMPWSPATSRTSLGLRFR